MAKRSHTTTVLAAVSGLLAGVLMGASAVQYAGLTASLEHFDEVYRNSRSIDTFKELGVEDPGNPGIRLEWHDQRTANSDHGVAPEELPMYCPGQSATRRSVCLLQMLDTITQELRMNEEGAE